jgi:hypothetical protein
LESGRVSAWLAFLIMLRPGESFLPFSPRWVPLFLALALLTWSNTPRRNKVNLKHVDLMLIAW